MMSLIFRLIFWGLLLSMGGKLSEVTIFKARDKMREMALKKASEPWPPLWAASQIDLRRNPYEKRPIKRPEDKPKPENKIKQVCVTINDVVDLYGEVHKLVKTINR